MYHMLSSFDLDENVSIPEFQETLLAFSAHMKKQGLLLTIGPLGRRSSDTPMDTDDERGQQFFFIMSFRDRDQCDAAYDYVDTELPSHNSVITKVKNALFTCWEDVD